MLVRCLIGAMLLVLCLLVPPVAGAVEEDEGAVAAFRLKASNGYRVAVLASRQPGEPRGELVMIVASKRDGVLYATRAVVEETGIHADLGELGRVDLEYVRLKGKERHSCGPGGEVSYLERGEYRGVFELHGEEGYTEARATRLRGGESVLFDLLCPGPAGSGDDPGPGLSGARLRSVLRQGTDSAVLFTIKNNRPLAPSSFKVLARERRGGIRIERTAEAIVGAGAFRYDPGLLTATVSPPSPFDGSATFRREASPRNRWSGDLTVDLPGRSDVSLVQPGFRVSLYNARLFRGRAGEAP